jgi:hypothetical protein
MTILTTRQILIKCWSNAGQMLIKYWSNTGQMLVKQAQG